MQELWLYAAVSRLRLLSYRGKIMLVAFVGTHIPLIAVAAYAALQASTDWRDLILTLLVALGATLAGTGVTLFALHHLLRPVMLTADALRGYRESRLLPGLPICFRDEAGRLMADARQTIEHLDDTARVLEHVNGDLESFSSAVAHDLRGPLRRMTGFAQMMAADIKLGEHADLPSHTDVIIDNARQMTELVDGMLALAHSSHGELARRRIEMAALVDEVLKDQQAHARARMQVGSLPAIFGDAATMRQVWANLISNALKYSARREAPHVEVDCRVEGAEAVFLVRDNGIGFDKAHAHKLFEAFQRLHGAEFEGSGVGLATVRRIVQRHGGRIWAESAPEAGATFYFSLPADLLAHP